MITKFKMEIKQNIFVAGKSTWGERRSPKKTTKQRIVKLNEIQTPNLIIHIHTSFDIFHGIHTFLVCRLCH